MKLQGYQELSGINYFLYFVVLEGMSGYIYTIMVHVNLKRAVCVQSEDPFQIATGALDICPPVFSIEKSP